MDHLHDKPDAWWEDFFKGFKYFGLDRMTFFMADAEALDLLKHAPERIKRAAYAKCQKLAIAWPYEDIAVDTTGMGQDDELFGDEAPTETRQVRADERPAGRIRKRFVCNRYPHYCIAIGKKMAQFEGGVFVTDDPQLIKAIEHDQYFNVYVFPG